MLNREVPKNWIDNVADWATIGGIYLGIDAIAVATRDGQPKWLAVVGFLVAYTSAIKLFDMLFSFLRDLKARPVARLVGGGFVIFLVLLFFMLLGFFRFAPAAA